MSGKRVPLSVRTTFDLRQRLEQMADASGRSLAQEVEFRLEQSLDDDRLRRLVRSEIEKLFEKPELLGVPESIMPNLSEKDRRDWLKQ